ncbi:MAG: Tim44/TimA family putative adaptor protein [Alphaproteobacteria bacterium]|nr:Tim44/TimA family putative adaptor protein [Alphaproteobacteria bacterium]
MNENIDIVTLIALIVAVVVILKLRSILGRRTDDDDARIEQQYRARQEAAASSDKVVTLPRRGEHDTDLRPDSDVAIADAEDRIKTFAGSNTAVRKGLLEILRLDPSFDPEKFLTGAKSAYEMIVTAFAAGNRRLLKDLLSTEVFEGFEGAIADRESRDEQIDQSFVGIDQAGIVEAEVNQGIASVTVRFASQLISATRDSEGAVIDGDPQKIKEVTDIWTFSRDISSARALANPNWKLVATLANA